MLQLRQWNAKKEKEKSEHEFFFFSPFLEKIHLSPDYFFSESIKYDNNLALTQLLLRAALRRGGAQGMNRLPPPPKRSLYPMTKLGEQRGCRAAGEENLEHQQQQHSHGQLPRLRSLRPHGFETAGVCLSKSTSGRKIPTTAGRRIILQSYKKKTKTKNT